MLAALISRAACIDFSLIICSGRITGGPGGGLAPLVVLKAPLVQLIFRGSGGPQNGPHRAAKRPP